MSPTVLAGLKRIFDRLANGPLLVHSDIVQVHRLAPMSSDRFLVLDHHFRNLSTLAEGRDLWFPAFNYRFTRSGCFDMRLDPSQAGVLSEHFRTHHARWRTAVPVFSITGTGTPPRDRHAPILDPFGKDSDFAQLTQQGGSVLFYGASLEATTFIHYLERTAGGPAYRYDKHFPGAIIELDGGERPVTLDYHVRPLNGHFDYDWKRLGNDLRRDDLLVTVEQPGIRLLAFDCKEVSARWQGYMREDPLYLLDAATRSWVEPMLQRLGRRFVLGDFEAPAERGDRLESA